MTKEEWRARMTRNLDTLDLLWDYHMGQVTLMTLGLHDAYGLTDSLAHMDAMAPLYPRRYAQQNVENWGAFLVQMAPHVHLYAFDVRFWVQAT